MTRSAAPRRSWLLAASAGVLVAVGMASVGWVGYQYVGSNAVSQRAFDTQRRELRETWAAPPERASGTATPMPEPSTRVIPGEAIALLRIPALGPAYEVPILSGTEQGTLARGVGH